MKLYELTEKYNQLLDMVTEDMDKQMIADTLEGLEGEIEDKAESMAKLMKNIEADEIAIKAEEERLYNRRKALENKRTGIKDYLEAQLISAGIDKVKGQIFTLAIQNNPPSLRMADDVKVPDKYLVPQEPKVDRRELLKDLKAGIEIKGCEIQQTRGLRIR